MAVVRGMDARNTMLSAKRPFPYGFGTGVQQWYSKELHPDVEEGKTRPVKGKNGDGDWVLDRWVTILRPVRRRIEVNAR